MAGPADLLVGETDGFAVDFTYYVLPITGTLAASETGADTTAIAAAVEVEGTLTAAETATDTAALAVVHTPISGALAATEAGIDVAAFVGNVSISASLAAIDGGIDVATFSAGHFAPIANWRLAGSRVISITLRGGL